VSVDFPCSGFSIVPLEPSDLVKEFLFFCKDCTNKKLTGKFRVPALLQIIDTEVTSSAGVVFFFSFQISNRAVIFTGDSTIIASRIT